MPVEHQRLKQNKSKTIKRRTHTHTWQTEERKLTIAWCPDHVVCRTRSAHAAAPSGKCSRSRKAKNSFSAWFLLPDHFILSLTSDEQRMYVQPRKGLGPGQGQGICCSPRTSLPTVTALPFVFLLLDAFEQARPCEETRGSEATVRLAQWCTCPRLGHEANFWHPSRAHARTRTWRPSRLHTWLVIITPSHVLPSSGVPAVEAAVEPRGCAPPPPPQAPQSNPETCEGASGTLSFRLFGCAYTHI